MCKLCIGWPTVFYIALFLHLFAFLCKVSYRGSIIVMNTLKKLSITYLVRHSESVTTPVLNTGDVNMNLSVQKEERSLCHCLAQCFPRWGSCINCSGLDGFSSFAQWITMVDYWRVRMKSTMLWKLNIWLYRIQ